MVLSFRTKKKKNTEADVVAPDTRFRYLYITCALPEVPFSVLTCRRKG